MTVERQSPSGRFRPGIVTRSLRVQVADLTAAGTTQTFNLGATLAATKSFQVLSTGCRVATAFTGGGVTAVTASIGSAGDPNAVTVFDVFAAVNGQANANTFGIAPGLSLATGVQLQVLFTSTGANLNLITAGDCTITVLLAQLT